MKAWIVVRGSDIYCENAGVHQLEDRAYAQANELMSVGTWDDPTTWEGHETGFLKAVSWIRDEDFVSIEEWEVTY